jgi:hypothetical protein
MHIVFRYTYCNFVLISMYTIHVLHVFFVCVCFVIRGVSIGYVSWYVMEGEFVCVCE